MKYYVYCLKDKENIFFEFESIEIIQQYIFIELWNSDCTMLEQAKYIDKSKINEILESNGFDFIDNEIFSLIDKERNDIEIMHIDSEMINEMCEYQMKLTHKENLN